MRIAIAVLLAAMACCMPLRAEVPIEEMVKVTLDGRTIEGSPLKWGRAEARLLGRDGRLWRFSPAEVTGLHKTSDRFRSYSASEFRASLMRDLGRGVEVTGTGHYLVAHPRGRQTTWPQRFEELHRSFVHYFAVRGLKPKEPPYPLVGIVCADRGQFARYSEKKGTRLQPSTSGYYSLRSNRNILYDIDGRSGTGDWHTTASVIIHEATHQTAFNTGVHNRWTPPPLWVAEGLATMFEARGVHDSRHYPNRKDRVNHAQLRVFKRLIPRHKPALIRSLIASDELFRANPRVGYAEAWALTFYLAETQPRKYMEYLAKTADYPPFANVTASQRAADFTAIFGRDWKMLEARFLRFMAGVK